MEFLRNNCRVSISGRKQSGVDAVVEELQKISENEACEGYVCEVTRATDIQELWNKASSCIDKAGDTKDITYLHQASDILLDLSHKEKEAMELLLVI